MDDIYLSLSKNMRNAPDRRDVKAISLFHHAKVFLRSTKDRPQRDLRRERTSKRNHSAPVESTHQFNYLSFSSPVLQTADE